MQAHCIPNSTCCVPLESTLLCCTSVRARADVGGGAFGVGCEALALARDLAPVVPVSARCSTRATLAMYTRLRTEPPTAHSSSSASVTLPGGGGGPLAHSPPRSPTPAAFADSLATLPLRAKRLLALAVALVVVVGGPLVLRNKISAGSNIGGRESPFGTFGGQGERLTTQRPPRRTANDGTPRAGVFRPLAGASSNNPSVSLSSYLESHFGPPTLPAREQPHVWLTMADATWARTGTAALHTFVERLNVERRARYGRREGGVRDTTLVVMCLDEECVETVGKYKDAYGRDTGGGYAYAGFMHNRPHQVSACLPRRNIRGIDASLVPPRSCEFADRPFVRRRAFV